MNKVTIKLVLLLTGLMIISWCSYNLGMADDENGPPLIVVQEEPELVIIPGTYVYYIYGYPQDVFFYDGYWYRQWHYGWYRAKIYSGGWVSVRGAYIPHNLTSLPNGWRQSAVNAPRLRYSEVRDNWRSWEKSRYWENNGWKRNNPNGDQAAKAGVKNENQEANNSYNNSMTEKIVHKPVSKKLRTVRKNNAKSAKIPAGTKQVKSKRSSAGKNDGKSSAGINEEKKN